MKKEEGTASLNLIRAKRKWQIALRRYVLEGQKSLYYAPFFGLDVASFREWIELQFTAGMSWDNFSTVWQFEHIVPVAYFDFEKEEDLRLCWSFINIRPQKQNSVNSGIPQVDVLTATTYFTGLLEHTNLPIYQQMVAKLETIEQEQESTKKPIEAFLLEHSQKIAIMATFTSEDFERVNTGTPYTELAFEKEFLKKFA